MAGRYIIGEPYITETEKEAVVNCNIHLSRDGGEEAEPEETDFLLHYAVPLRYGKYLVSERCDAFVVGVLPQAMYDGYDIECTAPMSERLYFQLTTMQIPAVENYMERWYGVSITAPLAHESLESKGMAGLAFSAGIDAFYSLKLLTETPAEYYHPDYLVLFKVGHTGSIGGSKEERLFNIRKKRIRAFAKEYHYKLLTISSNLSDFLDEKNIHNHTYRSMSAVLSMQKLFRVFYYSSGPELTDFKLNYNSCGCYDILTLPCLSTENTQLYSTGLAASRMQKVISVSEFEPSYGHLDTCLKGRRPDCDCEKCSRVRLELYAIGALEKYDKVYDIDYFKLTFPDHIDLMMKKSMGGGKKRIYRNIYKMFKKKGLSFEEYQPVQERKELEKQNENRVLDTDDLPWKTKNTHLIRKVKKKWYRIKKRLKE